MTENVIRASAISRNFGDTKAIQALDLEVGKGLIYGFLGPNGSGKTTAIRLLTGLLKPDAGEARVLGYSLPREADGLRMHIGYMTQKFSLYDDLTVRENMEFIASIYCLSGRYKKKRIEELLSVYDLARNANQMAGSMSGGQRQRLSLAAATLHKPDLLFLDEPTSAVDPENRRDFWEKLFDLSDAGATILVSTHYMDEAERCHRLAILESGIKRADGSPETLMKNLGAHVIEVESTGLRQVKQQLLKLPEIISVAQLGARLRVLVSDKVEDPIAFLQSRSGLTLANQLTEVRPSLEDVFVISTGAGRE